MRENNREQMTETMTFVMTPTMRDRLRQRRGLVTESAYIRHLIEEDLRNV